MNALRDVKAEWQSLGQHLGISFVSLNMIKVRFFNAPEECMKNMLRTQWLDKHPNKGWINIINALKKIGRSDVANQVTAKYCEIMHLSMDGGMHNVVCIICVY